MEDTLRSTVANETRRGGACTHLFSLEPPNETVEAYELRLKRVAKAIPASAIRAAVAEIKSKACEVVKAGGGKIRSD